MSNRSKHWLWFLAISAAALLVLKSIVPYGVFKVDTASMEPTILGTRQGGESVLVHYDRSAPARFDLVVALRAGEDVPVVKRVAGLPSERVQIVDGDLLVQGKRLGPQVPRPRPIAVFDERWADPLAAFPITAENQRFWKLEQGAWTLEAPAGIGPRLASELALRGDVKDSYFDAEHAFVEGEIPVNDLVLELDLAQDELGSRASLRLSEWGDIFELLLDLGQDGRLTASLVRRGEDSNVAPEVLGTAKLERNGAGFHHVRLSNIDNALCFERDGVRSLEVVYAENRYARADRLQTGHSILPRAAFGGAGGTLRFKGLVLARDLYYTPRGKFAVGEALDLGPDEYFLLGDNSSASRDGRDWRETRAEELIGRPARIVWPLSHARPLEGAVPPPLLVR
jgi:signal peptidase I